MWGSAPRGEVRSFRRKRRQTLGEQIPGFWAFAGLVITLAAIVVHPLIVHGFTPSERLLQAASADTNSNASSSIHRVEQELRAKLRAKADAQIKPAARPASGESREASPDQPESSPEKPR